MLRFFQILQIGFFTIPILGLILLGFLILIKPIFILHRRYNLLAFVPLLLANLLALIEKFTISGGKLALNWQLVLVVAVDLSLIIGGVWLLRGWQIYGLSQVEAANTLKRWFDERGWTIITENTEKSTWWGTLHQANKGQATRGDEALTFWLTRQGNQVQLQGENRKAQHYLHQTLSSLQHVEKPDQTRGHLAGVLYIILGIVLAVLVWIYFFEPRLILIE